MQEHDGPEDPHADSRARFTMHFFLSEGVCCACDWTVHVLRDNAGEFQASTFVLFNHVVLFGHNSDDNTGNNNDKNNNNTSKNKNYTDKYQYLVTNI